MVLNHFSGSKNAKVLSNSETKWQPAIKSLS